MYRPALLAAGLAACVVSGLAAQANTPSHPASIPDSTDVLIVDHEFTAGVGEFTRVFLQAAQVYRGELSTEDVTLEIRSIGRQVRLPRVYPLLASQSPSGSSIVELYPTVDAEYEVRPVRAAGAGGGISTRLRLYRDIRESRRRQRVIDQPSWEIGMELAGGYHSGFAHTQSPLPGEELSGGSNVELCFSARSAPGIPRLGMCALGLGYETQRGAKDIFWIFTEPRFRLLGRASRGKSNWELGALFRVGLGEISRSADVPIILAPGGYVARQIRRDASGRGWSLQLAYSHPTLYRFAKPLDGGEGVTPHSDRLLFGIGWYQ
ncbi:MAG TPA: hypothetical protein VHR41_11390 [Gemmatimonadales bacterium]|nr:hypothetical protein [Gemmatimonadales bacterium]